MGVRRRRARELLGGGEGAAGADVEEAVGGGARADAGRNQYWNDGCARASTSIVAVAAQLQGAPRRPRRLRGRVVRRAREGRRRRRVAADAQTATRGAEDARACRRAALEEVDQYLRARLCGRRRRLRRRAAPPPPPLPLSPPLPLVLSPLGSLGGGDPFVDSATSAAAGGGAGFSHRTRRTSLSTAQPAIAFSAASRIASLGSAAAPPPPPSVASVAPPPRGPRRQRRRGRRRRRRAAAARCAPEGRGRRRGGAASASRRAR